MVVGILTLEILIPASTSLKEKRMIIRSIKDRISKKFNVSIAEVEYQDKWQRAKIGIALVSSKKSFTEEVLNKIITILDSDFGFEVLNYEVEFV